MAMTVSEAMSGSDEPRQESNWVRADEVLRSFLGGLRCDRSEVVYVSTPITTGLEFYERVPKELLDGAHDDDPRVVAARVRAMSRNAVVAEETVARAYAARVGALCVNPTSLVVPGWSQTQYLNFWLEFIEVTVGTVVLAPGWQFSTGGVAECDLAFRQGLAVRDHNLEERDRDWAAGLLENAFARFRGWKVTPPPTLLAAAEALTKPRPA